VCVRCTRKLGARISTGSVMLGYMRGGLFQEVAHVCELESLNKEKR